MACCRLADRGRTRVGREDLQRAEARTNAGGASYAWWLLGTELAIALGATVLFGGFLADDWHLPRFAVPAIVLDVAAVLTIASAAAQLRQLSSLDYAQSVAIQSMLTELALRNEKGWHVKFTGIAV